MSDQPPSPTGGIVPPYISDKLTPKPKRMPRFDAVDIVAMVIAASLSISALVIVVASLITPGPSHLADNAIEAMGDIGKVLAGALAAYIGIRHRREQ